VTYPNLLQSIQAQSLASTRAHTPAVFQTDATGLFDTFLANLPPDERQHHDCSHCRDFVTRFGGLVAIDSDGRAHSSMWGDLSANDLGIYAQSVAAMQAQVEAARVTGQFFHQSTLWGTPESGGFEHMHATAMVAPTRRAHGRMAERREQFGLLERALDAYPREHLRIALNVLASVPLRGRARGRLVGPAEFLNRLHKRVSAVPQDSDARRNIIWHALAPADAPDTYCNPGASPIGPLLADIKAGYPFDALRQRFAERHIGAPRNV
jgi:hypothetical protein